MNRAAVRAYLHSPRYARDEANRRIALYEARLRAAWRIHEDRDRSNAENAADTELKKAQRALARAEKDIAEVDEERRQKAAARDAIEKLAEKVNPNAVA